MEPFETQGAGHRPAAGSRRSAIIIAALVAAILIVGLAFYRLGLLRGERLSNLQSDAKIQRLEKQLTLFYAPPSEILSLNGMLKKKEGSIWTVETTSLRNPIPENPGEQPKKELREVVLTPKTRFTDFNPQAPVVHDTITKASITAEQISVGDIVVVFADHNILEEKRFEAVEVQRSNPAPPPTAVQQ